MSGYSEIWEEMHKDKIEQERKAKMCREELARLSPEEMIKLIFTTMLKEMRDSEVIELYNNLPPRGN